MNHWRPLLWFPMVSVSLQVAEVGQEHVEKTLHGICVPLPQLHAQMLCLLVRMCVFVCVCRLVHTGV